MAVHSTHLERLVALEMELGVIKENQQKFEGHYKEMNGKLDELLSLRNKGIGAFWLASLLTGTGIIGVLVSMIGWWKGFLHG